MKQVCFPDCNLVWQRFSVTFSRKLFESPNDIVLSESLIRSTV
jgi:hypothetical protein